MAVRLVPPIDVLKGLRLRVLAPLGMDMENIGAPERQIWILFYDERKKLAIPKSLPVSLLPVLHAGAIFNDGIYRAPSNKDILSFLIDPQQSLIARRGDRLHHAEDDPPHVRYQVGSVCERNFINFGQNFQLYNKMPFFVFKNGLDYLIIPVIEVIRFYYATLCSSYVTRYIFNGKISHDNQLDEIINFERSDYSSGRVFVVLRKSLIKEDRTIAATLFCSKDDLFRKQAIEIISSLTQPKNRSTHKKLASQRQYGNLGVNNLDIGFSFIKFPFSELTKVEFTGVQVQRPGRGGKKHQIYFASRIVDSDFHHYYDELDYDTDNRNETKVDGGDLAELPVGWEVQSTTSKLLSPEFIETDGFIEPTTENQKFDIFLPNTLTEKLDEFPGKQLSELPQKSRSGERSEQDEDVGPVTPGTPTPDGSQTGVDILPTDTREKESDGVHGKEINRSKSLKTLSDAVGALLWLERKFDNITLKFFSGSQIFLMKDHIHVHHDWHYTDGIRRKKPRRMIFVELKIEDQYIYFLDVSNSGKPISSAVVRKTDYSVFDSTDYDYFLKTISEIRGRWRSESMLDSASSNISNEYILRHLSHSYTSIESYGIAIVRDEKLIGLYAESGL